MTESSTALISDITLGSAAGNIPVLDGTAKLPSAVIPTSVSGGKVLQVVHTSLADATFSTASTSYTDITGMSVAITPSATTSKILLMVNLNYDMGSTTSFAAIKALRGATDLSVGTAASNRIQCAAWGSSYSNQSTTTRSMTFLDSPSSTSEQTYKLQVNLDGSTFYLNRTATDTDNTSFGRTISTLTVMEIGA